jgi:hypothetical protein
MEKEWCELELLVEKIEKTLSPEGAIIKSPDFLVDKVTGSKREVDISVRFAIGSSDILIVIECRNRRNAQDVRWIEEIKTKHTDLGASKIIAVSKKGFSKDAIKKAKAHGIELRTFDEITESIIKNWNEKLIVEICTLSIKLHSLEFKYEEGFQEAKAILNWAKDTFKTIIAKSGEKEYTIESLIDISRLQEIMKGHTEERKVTLSVNINGQGKIQTDLGFATVLEMHIHLLISVKKEKLNTNDVTRYRNVENNKVYEFGTYHVTDTFGKNYIIHSHKKYDDHPEK